MAQQPKRYRDSLNGHMISIAKTSELSDFGNPKKFFGEESDNQYDLKFAIINLTDEGDNSNAFWFTRETLVAKHQTARLKPFNMQHNQKDIIGVIYDTAVVDQDGKILELGTDIELNEETGTFKFDESVTKVSVYAACALYTLVAPDEVEDICLKVEKGEDVPVSMECWYYDWDYMFKDVESGKAGKVARQKENAYLDDMINNVIGGKKICKLPDIEGFIFGGVGQVTKGACPNSIVLAVAGDIHSENVIGDSAFSDSGIKLMQEAANITRIDDSKNDSNSLKGESKEMGDQNTPNTPMPIPVVDTSALANQTDNKKLSEDYVSDLASASSQLGTATSKIEQLEKSIEKTTSDYATEKASLEAKIQEFETSKAKLDEEIANLKKVNSGLSNLVNVIDADKEVEFDAPLIDVAKDLELKDEAAVKEFIDKKKEDKKKKKEEQLATARKIKIETLGLAETATDEDIQKEIAAISANKNKQPPTMHRVAAPNADQTPNQENANLNENKDTMKITVHDSDSGKTVVV